MLIPLVHTLKKTLFIFCCVKVVILTSIAILWCYIGKISIVTFGAVKVVVLAPFLLCGVKVC